MRKKSLYVRLRKAVGSGKDFCAYCLMLALDSLCLNSSLRICCDFSVGSYFF